MIKETDSKVFFFERLTSAQIADLAIRKGARKVILICRGYLKSKVDSIFQKKKNLD